MASNIDDELREVNRALKSAEHARSRAQARKEVAESELKKLGITKKQLKDPDALLDKLKSKISKQRKKLRRAIENLSDIVEKYG